MNYGFGYGSLGPWPDSSMLLEEVIHFTLLSGDGSAAPGVMPTHIVLNIRRGGHPHHQVPAMGIATHC
jgi:hypothetical protein